jgi:hypothetical protein
MSTYNRFFLLLFLFGTGILQAQTTEMRNALVYKFLVTDYNTIDPTYREGNPDRYIHPDDINYGAEAGYLRYINSSLNVGATLRFGTIDAYHYLIDSTDANCISAPCNKRYFRNELFGGMNLLAAYKFNNGYILKENFPFSPYIQVGVAAMYMNKRSGHFDLQIPMGIGLNIRLRPEFSLQAQFDYNQSLIVKRNNFIISAGFVWTLGKVKAETESPETEK